MATGHLNLIFHGSFAFVYMRECIEVLIPDLITKPIAMGDPTDPNQAHALDQRHTYCLEKVNRPLRELSIPEQGAPVLSDFRVINRGTNALFCSLYLPFPEQWFTLRAVCNKKRDLFGGHAAGQIVAESVALVHALTYKHSEKEDLFLGDIEIDGPPKDHTRNFHLFSEGLTPARAFERLTRLFPGMDLKLESDEVDASPQRTELSRGLDEKDQLSLYENHNNQAHHSNPKHLSILVDNT